MTGSFTNAGRCLLWAITMACCLGASAQEGQVKRYRLVQLEEISTASPGQQDPINVRLKIEQRRVTDTVVTYTIVGLYHDVEVGMRIDVKRTIPAGIGMGGTAHQNALANAVRFTSIGKASDDLVQALSELYGATFVERFSEQPVIASCQSLNQTSVDLGTPQYCKLLLQLGGAAGEGPAQVYLNMDMARVQGVIEFNEMDVRYRDRLVLLLSGER